MRYIIQFFDSDIKSNKWKRSALMDTGIFNNDVNKAYTRIQGLSGPHQNDMQYRVIMEED